MAFHCTLYKIEEKYSSEALCTSNKIKVYHSYCIQRGQRGPEKLGQTLFAPKCHGWHRHSYGFPPVPKDICQPDEVVMINVDEEHF